jgi:hypothetical protein
MVFVIIINLSIAGDLRSVSFGTKNHLGKEVRPDPDIRRRRTSLWPEVPEETPSFAVLNEWLLV